ncbi:hypothetical protein LCGC14_2284290, partial [marine sediment metagenome]
ELYLLRDKYPYTIAKIVYDAITQVPHSLSAVVKLIGYKPGTVPVDDLAYIIKIWTLFGQGPSPYQIRKMVKYDSAYWGTDRIRAVLQTLQEYGYDFNAKYISQTTNEPVFFSLFEQDILVDLILEGRINVNIKSGIDDVLNNLGNQKLIDAVKAWRYVESRDIKKLCKATGLDYFKETVRDKKLEKIAYQLQLRETEKIDVVCDCLTTMIKAQKEGVFPYEQFDNGCDNDYTLDMVAVKNLARSQMIEYIDKEVLKKDNTGKRVYPKYCFDKGNVKKLLETGINPYTNTAFADKFTDSLLDHKEFPVASSLEDSVTELAEHGNLSKEPPQSDFHQILLQLTSILSKINPYLNYESWATQYKVEDYRQEIPKIGFPGFVQAMDLGVVNIVLPQREYITQLMAVLLNRMEKNDLTVETVLGGVVSMLEYLKIQENVEDVPVKKDLYADMSMEALNAKKSELMKQFIAGGMNDQSLMQEIQNIRQKVMAMDTEE